MIGASTIDFFLPDEWIEFWLGGGWSPLAQDAADLHYRHYTKYNNNTQFGGTCFGGGKVTVRRDKTRSNYTALLWGTTKLVEPGTVVCEMGIYILMCLAVCMRKTTQTTQDQDEKTRTRGDKLGTDGWIFSGKGFVCELKKSNFGYFLDVRSRVNSNCVVSNMNRFIVLLLFSDICGFLSCFFLYDFMRDDEVRREWNFGAVVCVCCDVFVFVVLLLRCDVQAKTCACDCESEWVQIQNSRCFCL